MLVLVWARVEKRMMMITFWWCDATQRAIDEETASKGKAQSVGERRGRQPTYSHSEDCRTSETTAEKDNFAFDEASWLRVRPPAAERTSAACYGQGRTADGATNGTGRGTNGRPGKTTGEKEHQCNETYIAATRRYADHYHPLLFHSFLPLHRQTATRGKPFCSAAMLLGCNMQPTKSIKTDRTSANKRSANDQKCCWR